MIILKSTEFEYPVIDQKKTGAWLRILCKFRGYSVKDLQKYLHISSNQAIYEWFNGHTLPSINNLLALSVLLDIPMNDLLVDNVHNSIGLKHSDEPFISMYNRLHLYYLLLNRVSINRV